MKLFYTSTPSSTVLLLLLLLLLLPGGGVGIRYSLNYRTEPAAAWSLEPGAWSLSACGGGGGGCTLQLLCLKCCFSKLNLH